MIRVVFRIFLFTAFCGFSGFAKEVTPHSRAKTGVIPRDHLYSVLPFLLKEWMINLVCLGDVIGVVTEKLKITSKQRTTSQKSLGWDTDTLWT